MKKASILVAPPRRISSIFYLAVGLAAEGDQLVELDEGRIHRGRRGSPVHQGLGADTFAANGTSTRFVLDHGIGDELITGFQVAGAGHDTVSLPNSDASRLANILADATSDGQGDTTIKIGQGDTVTFAGVSVAQLQKHAGDFVFHA